MIKSSLKDLSQIFKNKNGFQKEFYFIPLITLLNFLLYKEFNSSELWQFNTFFFQSAFLSVILTANFISYIKPKEIGIITVFSTIKYTLPLVLLYVYAFNENYFLILTSISFSFINTLYINVIEMSNSFIKYTLILIKLLITSISLIISLVTDYSIINSFSFTLLFTLLIYLILFKNVNEKKITTNELTKTSIFSISNILISYVNYLFYFNLELFNLGKIEFYFEKILKLIWGTTVNYLRNFLFKRKLQLMSKISIRITSLVIMIFINPIILIHYLSRFELLNITYDSKIYKSPILFFVISFIVSYNVIFESNAYLYSTILALLISYIVKSYEQRNIS